MADIAVLGLRVDASGAVVATEQMAQKLNALGQQADKTTDSMGKTVAQLAAIGISAAGFLAAVKQAQVFEKQMALVSTVTDSSTASVRVLSKQVLDLYRALPVGSLDELTSGLYDILSAGVPAAKAIELLDVAARAAIAGVTTTAVAVDGLTTVLAAFRDQNLTAAEAADSMFQAVNVGKITFEQLAGSIGKVAPVAAAYDISLNDLLASTAQLTLGGLSAEESFTAIRSAINNIINPTGELVKVFPQIAKEFSATRLEAGGLTKFLTDFNKATGGSKDALNALFTDIQGKVGVLSLLSDGGEAVVKQLNSINDATGAAGTAFDKLSQTSEATNQILLNNFKATLIELSTRALPAVNAVLSAANVALTYMRDNLPLVAGAIAAATAGFIAYAVATRTAATWTSILTAAQGIQAFLQLARTVRSAADAMALLSIVGKGAAGAVAAIAAIVAGYTAYRIAVNAIEEDQKKFNEELERTAKALASTPPTPTAVVTPTGTVPAGGGLSDEDVQRARDVAAAASERVRVAQQEFDLVGKIGLAAELQAVANRAELETLRARATLKGAELSITLEAIEQEKQLSAATVAARRALTLDRENTDRIKNAKDTLALVGLEGKALRDAQIEQRKQNELSRAKLELTGFELQNREAAIETEARISLEASNQLDILEQREATQERLNQKAKAALDEQGRLLKNFERQFLQTVSTGFQGLLTNGMRSFQDFVSAIRDMFVRMFSDVLASAVFKRLSGALAGLVPGRIDINTVANANVTGSGLGSTALGLAGAGLGAAAVGYGVGSMTTNRGLGFAGGAAAGAALGTIVPGVGNLVGAIVGGIAGGIAGLIGSSNAAKKSAEAAAVAQKRFNESLDAMRENLEGNKLAAAIKQTNAEFQKLREQAIDEAYSGKKNEPERRKALEEINRLEQLRIEQLRQEYAEQQRTLQINAEVRRLRAKGEDEAANALAFTLAQEAELSELRKSGADETTIAAVKAAQLAEAEKRLSDERKAAAQKLEDERRRIAELSIGALAFTDPRGASDMAFAETQTQRIFDAIQRGASNAELAAIAYYNAAEKAARQADRLESDGRVGESLLARGLTAAGNTQSASDRAFAESQRRELADAIREGMSPSNLALLQFVQFAEREARLTQRAIEEGTKAIRERETNDLKVIDALIEATQSDQKTQLAALDEQIELARTQAKATRDGFDAQIKAIESNTKAQLKAIDEQIKTARDQLEASREAVATLERQVASSRSVVASLSKFTEETQTGELSTRSPEQQLDNVRARFEQQLALALSGDARAAEGLPETAKALLELSRAFNASGSAFTEDAASVLTRVAQVQSQFEKALSKDERLLVAAQSQVASAEAQLVALDAQRVLLQNTSEAQLLVLREARDAAAEASTLLLESLEAQKDAVTDAATKTLEKLDAQRQAIRDAAAQEIQTLIALENAKLQTRIRENAFYDQFATYAANANAFFMAAADAVDVDTPPVPSIGNAAPVQVEVAPSRESSEQLQLLQEQNRLLAAQIAVLAEGLTNVQRATESVTTAVAEQTTTSRRSFDSLAAGIRR